MQLAASPIHFPQDDLLNGTASALHFPYRVKSVCDKLASSSSVVAIASRTTQTGILAYNC